MEDCFLDPYVFCGVYFAGPLFGFPVTDRAKVDTANFWTYVDRRPVKDDGIINRFNIFVEKANRPFRIGVFRSTSAPCGFQLVQQVRFESGFQVGRQTVSYFDISSS